MSIVAGEREPDGSKVYVTNHFDNTVSVIATATSTVTATIPVGSGPSGVAVTPDGTKVYVANNGFGFGTNVSVIDAATNTVIATIPVGSSPSNVAVTPDGRRVYVANFQSNNVSVIAKSADFTGAKKIRAAWNAEGLVASRVGHSSGVDSASRRFSAA
jgi:YVTN family beta-propeller protein